MQNPASIVWGGLALSWLVTSLDIPLQKPLVPSHNVGVNTFTPESLPISTIGDDGTSVARYDVRETMMFLPASSDEVNCYYYDLLLTTEDDCQYEETINICLVNKTFAGTISAIHDLQTGQAGGASAFLPYTADINHLDIRSSITNLTSPADSDNFTDVYVSNNYGGVVADLHIQPTGQNFYYGGSGGFTLPPPPSAAKVNDVVPGWTWYWSNPNLRISGTTTVNGKTKTIDSARSLGWFERQWGRFDLSRGYVAFWLYLDNGVIFHSWILSPSLDGFGPSAIASSWHSSGLHEVIPLSNETRAWDIWEGSTGKKYFTEFYLSMPAKDSVLRISQFSQDTEVTPMPGTIGHIISESYAQGNGTWNGEPVQITGHIEQYSFL